MRVVIADDAMLMREGTARLLEDAGFEIVGTVDDADKLLRAVALERPDVAIVDIKMPPTYTDEGLVAAEKIRSTYPEVGVLVLSQYLESRYALRLLEQHPEAVGYLLKERVSDIAVLADAIRRIAEGESVLDPTIVARLVNRPRHTRPPGRTDGARARGPGPDRRGSIEQRHRAVPGPQPQDRGGPRRPDLLEAGPGRDTRPSSSRPRRAGLPACLTRREPPKPVLRSCGTPLHQDEGRPARATILRPSSVGAAGSCTADMPERAEGGKERWNVQPVGVAPLGASSRS